MVTVSTVLIRTTNEGNRQLNKKEDSPSSLDLIWGVSEIAKMIGRTERQTYHMIQSGNLPMVKQVGERYVASRSKLIAFFIEDAA